jgi:hypothetical protein
VNLLLPPTTKRRWSKASEEAALRVLEEAEFEDRFGPIVYGLTDFETGEIRYVGCCENGVGYRIARHFYFAERGKAWRVSEWLRSVDFRVGLVVLAVDPPNPRAVELEWIHRLLAADVDLTNYCGGPTTERQKRAATTTNIERWASPEARAALADANCCGLSGFKGRKHTAETREKIGKASRGIRRGSPSEETRRKMSESAKSRHARVKEVMPS